MRISASYIFAGILISLLVSSAPLTAAETEVTPQPTVAPTLTAEQPVNPVSSKPGGPILVSISVHLGPTSPLLNNSTPQTIIPEFNFVAPNGNAVLLHRDMVETSANNLHLNPATAINIPPDAQKHGASIAGGWTCNQGQYYATMTAYIMDADGNRSNAVRYTVHCNGG
jgi:hypothetical protein